MKDSVQAIDIVNAVDGNDSNLKQTPKVHESSRAFNIEDIRFASNDEIYFCIAHLKSLFPIAEQFMWSLINSNRNGWISLNSKGFVKLKD